jgi:hypothetical protein
LTGFLSRGDPAISLAVAPQAHDGGPAGPGAGR